MLEIIPGLEIADSEYDLTAIRSQGAGGQNVNKVSSAIHLRFDIQQSSLPDSYKQGLLNSRDSRITQEGVLVLKSQNYRTQEQNRQDAIDRLAEIIRKAGEKPKPRRATKPSKAAKARRVDSKKKQGQQKSLRGRINID